MDQIFPKEREEIEFMNITICQRHIWIKGKGSDDIPCLYCHFCPIRDNRCKCSDCKREACRFCLRNRSELPTESTIIAPGTEDLVSHLQEVP